MRDEDIVSRLTEAQLDALKEAGNIGAGNAATALYQIIGKKIMMSVPRAAVIPLSEVPDVLGGSEVLVAGVFLRVLGDAPGSILFVMPKDSALYLVDMLMGRPESSTQVLSEMDQSALKEIGNILASSYLNALASFTKLTFLPTVPALAFDMAGAILDVILVELGQLGDYALLIETRFQAESAHVEGHFFLIPDPGALSIILKALGVGDNGAGN
ncbi:MAG: chemotaxis protein CheC [Synergistetes bacterium]|nr:MAG: CheC, inhibitor of MCP methylation [bacterium 42_11]MBC7330993.1 chemotaxis protein CheC [Synergistota bacterium]MDK2871616.1 chemotaxis protein CheC [bacterium]